MLLNLLNLFPWWTRPLFGVTLIVKMALNYWLSSFLIFFLCEIEEKIIIRWISRDHHPVAPPTRTHACGQSFIINSPQHFRWGRGYLCSSSPVFRTRDDQWINNTANSFPQFLLLCLILLYFLKPVFCTRMQRQQAGTENFMGIYWGWIDDAEWHRILHLFM